MELNLIFEIRVLYKLADIEFANLTQFSEFFMEEFSHITISANAAKRVGQLMSDSDLGLRVYVEGGGCSGFQYGFQLEREQQADDVLIEQNGITLLVDSLSIQYLMGSQVDYIDDLIGARFFISNPNASTTCGCGSSFSI